MNNQREKRLILFPGYYYLKKKQMAKKNCAKRFWVHPLIAQRSLNATLFSDPESTKTNF